MYRRAAVAGPANPLVIIVVAVGLVVVALVSVAVRAGAVTTVAPSASTPNCVRAERDLTRRHVNEQLVVLPGQRHGAASASPVWDQTGACPGRELGSPKP